MSSYVVSSGPIVHEVAVKQPGEDTAALLRRWDDPVAREQIFNIVYPELRRMAAARMRQERNEHTLQPTALVNEAFLLLVRQNAVDWQGRAHFLAIASQAMKRILMDHARRRNARKHGGGVQHVPGVEVSRPDLFSQLLEIDQLLEQLKQHNARVVETFELHYFGGLTFDQIAEVLKIASKTAKRDWQIAVAWLGQVLRPKDDA